MHRARLIYTVETYLEHLEAVLLTYSLDRPLLLRCLPLQTFILFRIARRVLIR